MIVAIARFDISASELREAAAGTGDARAGRRMLAIALVLDGWSRDAAAEACAMDRQTLRDWVHRYNESGPDGLSEDLSPDKAGGMTARLCSHRSRAEARLFGSQLGVCSSTNTPKGRSNNARNSYQAS